MPVVEGSLFVLGVSASTCPPLPTFGWSARHMANSPRLLRQPALCHTRTQDLFERCTSYDLDARPTFPEVPRWRYQCCTGCTIAGLTNTTLLPCNAEPCISRY